MGKKRDADGNIHSYGNGYVYLIGSELFSRDPGKYEIINRCISGNRIVDLYVRVKVDAWNEELDCLSILIGVNDVWYVLSERPNGVELDRLEKVYRMLIEDTMKRLPNTRIILCEPFILQGTATNERYSQFMQVYNYASVAKKLAQEYGIDFVSLQAVFDEKAKIYGAMHYLHDGVHPHIASEKLIATEWLKVFDCS